MTYTSVLFDLDGTLLKTADDLGPALNYVLEQHGKPVVSAKQYIPQSSNGAIGLLKLGFGASIADHDLNALRSQFLDYYANNIARHTNYFIGVTSTLKTLNENNIPWGIVTNKPGNLTTALLNHFPLLENCHCVVSGDTVGIAKPDPKPMFYGFNLMQQKAAQAIKSQDCIYVGDAQRDIEAGKNAGMKTAAALYGYIDENADTTAWNADYHLDSIEQLLDLV